METVGNYQRASSGYPHDLNENLHRTWRDIVTSTSPRGMGNKLSAQNSDTPADENISPRPRKRRRVVLEDSADAGSALADRLQCNAENDDADFEKAFRVEILSITRGNTAKPKPVNLRYGNGSPEKLDIPVLKARCKLTLFEHAPGGLSTILYCDSQSCDFTLFRDSDDMCRTARIYLPVPFDVPTEKLSVQSDTGGWQLAREYLVRVEIEFSETGKWPPVDMLTQRELMSLGSGNTRRWNLCCTTLYVLGKGKHSGAVRVRKSSKAGDDCPVDLAMDMDFRWSVGHNAASAKRVGSSEPPPNECLNHSNGVLAPLTNGHVNGRADHPMNDCDKAEDKAESDRSDQAGLADDDEDVDEATTPSRSLRTREKQNYNLKLLSDKARGKELKERKQRKLANIAKQEGMVTWYFPAIGEILLDSYQCVRCYAPHATLHHLVEHVETHTDIRFSINVDRAYLRILPVDDDGLCSAAASLASLGPDDHDSDFEGDESPQKSPRKFLHQKNAVTQPTSYKPRQMKQLVPTIKQPIYDRVSKALLEPGSLVDSPPVNDTWLVQKHRDIVRDYSDVDAGEKEYIYEWDAFVNRDCVTSEPHLQDVYIRFVQDKAPWIVASQNRTAEWAKHLSYLKSRNALTDSTIAHALSIIRRLRSQMPPGEEEPEPAKTPSPRTAYRKSVAGCAICGQPVRGPASLICSNLKCDNALYHVGCIRSEAVQPVESRNWRCNICQPESTAIA
ncbi:hypothetical protein F5Y18DRAFT_371003 [Xylariaceae sp. FL1019]|nr:hypothetical protein F5Y18DRAFT_371003 [Xylariaceae sp. FL1019]